MTEARRKKPYVAPSVEVSGTVGSITLATQVSGTYDGAPLGSEVQVGVDPIAS